MKTQSYRVKHGSLSLDTLNRIADGEKVLITINKNWLSLSVSFESDYADAGCRRFEDLARLHDVVLERR